MSNSFRIESGDKQSPHFCCEHLFNKDQPGKKSSINEPWQAVFYPLTLRVNAICFLSNPTARKIVVVFTAFSETILNIATLGLKPLFTYVKTISGQYSGVSKLYEKARREYKKGNTQESLKHLNEALIAFDTKSSFNSLIPSVQKQKAQVYMLMGDCYRTKKNSNKAKEYWQKAASITDLFKKTIDHKLIKLDLLTSDPLFKLDPNQYAAASNWEIVASRTFCEKIFTAAQRTSILERLKKMCLDPVTKPMFDVVANDCKKYPDKTNIAIITPKLMDRYKKTPHSIRGFFNNHHSVGLVMDKNSRFSDVEAGTFVHESSHMGIQAAIHRACCKPSFSSWYGSPFACNDQTKKKEYEKSESELLFVICEALESAAANQHIDFNKIEAKLKSKAINSDNLLNRIKACKAKAFSKNQLSADQRTAISRILLTYDSAYRSRDVPSEIIVRTLQVHHEIKDPNGLKLIDPMMRFYHKNVVPELKNALIA